MNEQGKDPSEENLAVTPPADSVYNFFMKFYFYLGLVVYLPYTLIKLTIEAPIVPSSSTLPALIVFSAAFLVIMFIMDNVGLYSSFLDRISRLIPLIEVLFAVPISVVLFFLNRGGLNEYITWKFALEIVLLLTFAVMGWYFIREEHGLVKLRRKPSYKSSMLCLLICGFLLFAEMLFSGAIFIGLSVCFTLYPISILIWGHPKVVPHIKPHQLTNPYQRSTFYNFVIDLVRAAAVLLTIVSIIYDGSVILFPKDLPVGNDQWVANLAYVALWASIAMGLFFKMQDLLFGLSVVMLLFCINILHFLLVFVFHVQTWLVIGLFNGVSLAGVYFFIEQKMYKSDNVRAMPGSFYTLIFLIINLSIILRLYIPISMFLDYAKLLVGLIGIAYILGYIRETPKAKSLRISL